MPKMCSCPFLRQYLWFAILRIANHSVFKTQNKTVPIFARKLRKFFAKKNFFLGNLDSASKVGTPPPPHKWEFWFLANLNSASNSVNPPPPQMGILDFSKFELSIKFHDPPPTHIHTHTWEFWILANLNSASNSATPRIGKCANHFEPPTGGASFLWSQFHIFTYLLDNLQYVPSKSNKRKLFRLINKKNTKTEHLKYLTFQLITANGQKHVYKIYKNQLRFCFSSHLFLLSEGYFKSVQDCLLSGKVFKQFLRNFNKNISKQNWKKQLINSGHRFQSLLVFVFGNKLSNVSTEYTKGFLMCTEIHSQILLEPKPLAKGWHIMLCCSHACRKWGLRELS